MIKKTISKLREMFSQIKAINKKLDAISIEKERNLYDYKSTKVNLGEIHSALNNQKTKISSLSEVEFQVFSQFGDDGIIQWLTNYLDIDNKTFVEFGVEKYIEANTRFLLFKDKWRGLVIDGESKNIEYIKNDVVSYFFNLESICSFITKDNISDLIKSRGFDKDLGILSIDIDGNDYWIWKSLVDINPTIIICEYNAEFGLNPWVLPYQEDFVWDKEKAMYYWGTSLKSIYDLAEERGYSFIGCNSQGNNAYFIRNDKMKDLKKLSCEEGFVLPKFSLKRKLDLEQYTGKEKRKELVGKNIFNTKTSQLEIIDEE